MNFLAHAYLSFNHPQIVVGNMISDFVKGKAKFMYPPLIQQGMQLHREIDAYTDAHPATAAAKEIFKPAYRLYSGAVVDILYDYYLATDESIFTPESLQQFATGVYQTLYAQEAHLPPTFAAMLPHMESGNWLYNYSTTGGMQRSLAGMVRRAAYLTDSDTAYQLFITHRQELKVCYDAFIPGVKLMAKGRLAELLL